MARPFPPAKRRTGRPARHWDNDTYAKKIPGSAIAAGQFEIDLTQSSYLWISLWPAGRSIPVPSRHQIEHRRLVRRMGLVQEVAVDEDRLFAVLFGLHQEMVSLSQ